MPPFCGGLNDICILCDLTVHFSDQSDTLSETRSCHISGENAKRAIEPIASRQVMIRDKSAQAMTVIAHTCVATSFQRAVYLVNPASWKLAATIGMRLAPIGQAMNLIGGVP